MADIDGRSVTWAFIVYPESAPDNWIDIIRDTHTLGAISPIHDKDENPDHSFKKAHYHVLLKFPTKKSMMQVCSIARKCGFHGAAEAVDNFDGYLRYLIHIDNPEKYQYSIDDIIPLAGLDVKNYFAPSKSRCAEVLNDIWHFIHDHPDIQDWDILMGYAYGNKQWEYVLNNLPCYGITKTINARAFRSMRKEKKDDR